VEDELEAINLITYMARRITKEENQEEKEEKVELELKE